MTRSSCFPSRGGAFALALAAIAVTSAAGCAEDPVYTGSTPGGTGTGGTTAPDNTTVTPVGPAMNGLHVMGNVIQNADGLTVQLRGVNRSGTEYQCQHGAGIFDGPATLASIAVMAAWKINAVRIPLNESCWLGINGVAANLAGDSYKRAILDYVGLLHRFHMVPILDLHWVGPGTNPATMLQPMPDLDHTPAFWTDVANTFAADDGVIFELFNEPFPDRNRDSNAGWTCWRDGCTATLAQPRVTGQPAPPAMTYQAVGMQDLVNAIRATGSRHVILLGGLQYSNALSQWLAFAPMDTAANLAAAWHVYNFNACSSPTCWDGAPATVAARVPIVATEIGDNGCTGGIIEPLMDWYDAHGVSYLAWTWNHWEATCVPPTPPATQGGRPFSLIADYVTGAPNSAYAAVIQAHFAAF